MADYAADGFIQLCGESALGVGTRLYLPSSGGASILPAFDAAWEKTTTYRYATSTSKKGTGFLEVSNYENVSTTPYDMAVAQFTSPAIRAQRIQGTVWGQILARCSNAAADFSPAIVIKVVTPGGYTRGTLLSYFPAALTAELNSTGAVNRKWPPKDTPLTPVDAQEGDRIVIEVGIRAFNAGTTSYYAYLLFGDIADGDLPDNETEQEYRNPFVEFSQDIAWVNDAAYAAAGYMKLCGESVLSDGSELISAYAADGFMQLCGESILDSPGDNYIADGYLALSAPCVMGTNPLAAYRADGFMQLCGAGQMASTEPYVDPSISQITAFAAAGGVSLYSDCVLGKPEELRSDYIAGGCLLICGGCNLGTPSLASLTRAFVADGYIMFGGAGGLIQGPVSNYAAETESGPCLRLSGGGVAAFIFPPVSDYAADGGVSLVGSGVLGGISEEGDYETLVLTGNRSEISFYTNFNFNSYAKYKGKYYGCTENGVFSLEGEDDDGAGIVPGVRIGPANYGTDREKRLRLVRCGGKTDQARVRVFSDTGLEETKPVIGGRADISRLVQGREITVDIAGFETLNFLQIVPLILAKR